MNRMDASHKLLYCRVISKNYSRSERFIELDNFKLWSYMMFHKHGLKIRDISLWLWVKEKDYLARQELYSRAPEIMRVNKLGLFLFDEQNGFSHIIQRFAKEDDSDRLGEILMTHLSPQLLSDDNFELTVYKGYCIKNENTNLEELVLGLSAKDDRFWYREK